MRIIRVRSVRPQLCEQPEAALGQIKDIIDLQREGTQPCAKVLRMVETHIRDIDRTIADLRSLQKFSTSRPGGRTGKQAQR